MPVAVRSVASSNNGGVASATISLDSPAHQAGDLLIAVVYLSGASVLEHPTVVSISAGWTHIDFQIGGVPLQFPWQAGRIHVYYQWAQSTVDGALAVTASHSEGHILRIVAFSGADSTVNPTGDAIYDTPDGTVASPTVVLPEGGMVYTVGVAHGVSQESLLSGLFTNSTGPGITGIGTGLTNARRWLTDAYTTATFLTHLKMAPWVSPSDSHWEIAVGIKAAGLPVVPQTAPSLGAMAANAPIPRNKRRRREAGGFSVIGNGSVSSTDAITRTLVEDVVFVGRGPATGGTADYVPVMITLTCTAHSEVNGIQEGRLLITDKGYEQTYTYGLWKAYANRLQHHGGKGSRILLLRPNVQHRIVGQIVWTANLPGGRFDANDIMSATWMEL